MLLLLVLLLWLSTLYFIVGLGVMHCFSWCLLSWWQQWWLQIEVLWWWWWSLQWLIGKSVSSYFGHHFLKMFVLLLWSSIWFKKHFARVKYCDASSPIWVEKNIYEFTGGKYHFFLFIYVNWKKTICEPTSVQYHFFFFSHVSKKNQVCNINYFLHLCE
jgi:hypothetical protein